MHFSGRVICLGFAWSIFMASATFPAKAGDVAEQLADLVASNTRGQASGLGLYLGLSDTAGLAKFAERSKLYVQGVVADSARAAQLRSKLATFESTDRVSIVWRRTQHLPYLDNLVNAIVAEGWGSGDLNGLALSEIVRVLCPDGVAVVGSDAGLDAAGLLAEAGKLKLAKAEKLPRPGAWIRIVKLRDPDFGEWPSFAGGPEMTMVSNDKALTPGKEIRWVNGPEWSTSVSFSNTVLCGGRAFHRELEYLRPDPKNPSYFVGQWSLVARNAYNGCDLWREKINGSRKAFAADEARVYYSDGEDLLARDAVTGKVVKNYGPGIHGVTVVGNSLLLWMQAVTVMDKETGQVRWKGKCIAPPATKDGVVYLLKDEGVEAVTLADGKRVWDMAVPAVKEGRGGTIMCKGDNVYITQGGTEGIRLGDGPKKFRTIALNRADGRFLWMDVRNVGHSMLPFDDVVWITTRVPDPKYVNVNLHTLLDIKTGNEVKAVRGTFRMGSHCWGPRATERFAFFDMNILMDRQSGETFAREGIRSSCGYGQFPAYGLEYNTPHPCNCGVSLRGCAALSGGSAMPKGEVAPALIRGTGAAAGSPASPGDWPMYRADAGRSNAYTGDLPAQLKKRWSAKIGTGPVPQATGAGRLVFAADTEGHRVVALQLETGKPVWSFATEGRVSIPPTYHKGACFFGDHAGWVYCVEAASGKLVWQQQAAPEQRYMSALNQFESSWPVKSGVLVLDDGAYWVAGRISPMEGGLHVYGVDAASGQQRWKRNFTDIRPADMLMSDGKTLHFAGASLSPVDGSDHRAPRNAAGPRYLQIGSSVTGRIAVLDMLDAGKDPLQARDMKTLPNDGRAFGQMIAFDKDRSIASWRCRAGSKDFARADEGRCYLLSRGAPEWTNKDTAQQMMGLVLAGTRVYGAGVPETRESQEKPKLWVFAADTGKELQRLDLDSAPSMDGLSAVGGALLLTTADGQVHCFGAP